MGWIDGKPLQVTEAHLKTNWSGYRDGRKFRCGLCGHRFQLGDTFRFVMANINGSPTKYGNFFTCASCDGDDVLQRRAAMEREAETRFWWFRQEID